MAGTNDLWTVTPDAPARTFHELHSSGVPASPSRVLKIEMDNRRS